MKPFAGRHRAAIVYPPITRYGLYPHLGQNRQLQFTHSAWIKPQPMIPAYLATLLRRGGAEVLWLDAIARGIDWERFEAELRAFKPGWIIMETKAPVIEDHWRIIDRLKERLPDTNIALVGDHVSFFPEESFAKSKVDAVVAGGDYDLALSDLILHERISKGVWLLENGQIAANGFIDPNTNLDRIPFPDRALTRMSDYGEAYLLRPCAYIISGRGCGRSSGSRGACTFCIWQQAFWRGGCRFRSAENAAEEIAMLARKFGVREIFDDTESGMLWNIEWMENFHRELSRLGVLGRITISSNARADALTDNACRIASASGFRLLKVGLESGSNKTLDRINKGETVEQIIQGVKCAKRHGLRVFLTVMIGYPWESELEIKSAWRTARALINYHPRLGDGLQVSLFTPYPGTEAFRQLRDSKSITENGYSVLDMNKPLFDIGINLGRWMRKFWLLYLQPRFLIGNLLSLRDSGDISYVLIGIRSLWGHIKDAIARRLMLI